MYKRIVALAIGIFISASQLSVLAHGVPGTKERITFEGLVGRHERDNIPDYDGFGWSGTIYAIGKGLYKDQQGFHAVVKGKVAAAFFAGTGQDGIISRDDGSKFTFRSGHFAAFGNFNSDVTFSAYRKGILIGTRSLTLAPADTLVQFDKTFAHIDRFVIDGQSVAFDNLHVSF
jgi:hypothetical protein